MYDSRLRDGYPTKTQGISILSLLNLKKKLYLHTVNANFQIE